MLKKISKLKDAKNLKPKQVKKMMGGLVKKIGSKAKPALAGMKKARKAFPIPGLDMLLGALTAAIEISMGAAPGNAIMGAMGGILGSVAGTAAGSAALPGPGSFVGAMAGGIVGEIAGRKLARMIGGI